MDAAEKAEKQRAYQRAYYAAHREDALAKMKEYYARTFADRRDRKNAQTRERRRLQNWYRQNCERIKAERKRWYAENREFAREKHKERAVAIRMAVLEHYGCKCTCCGVTEPKFLSIDHIDGGGTEHRKKLGLSGKAIYYWLIKNNFPPGFQVLCHNCNMAKGLYGVCPHQERKSN